MNEPVRTLEDLLREPAGPWRMDRQRRELLKAMAASAALMACSCSRPRETIVAASGAPSAAAPDEPVYYATQFERAGRAQGVLVKTVRSRPIKVEGNPAHPVNRGATDAQAQASVLQFWDPDRARAPTRAGVPATWGMFESDLRPRLGGNRTGDGSALRLLTGGVGSPTLIAQIEQVLAAFPGARWHRHDASEDTSAVRALFGRCLSPRYRLEEARLVLALDGDPIAEGPDACLHARAFSRRRETGTRWYAIESARSLTGAAADARAAMHPAAIERFLEALFEGMNGDAAATAALDARDRRLLAGLVPSLQAGAAVLLPGPRLSMRAQILAHRINARLGAHGRLVEWFDAPDARSEPVAPLLDDMHAGRVEALLMLDCNPAYELPPAAGFVEALERVPLSAQLSLHRDETGRRSVWHLPLAHPYERWGNARAGEGTAGIVQPVVAPRLDVHSPHELLAMVRADGPRDGYTLVRDHWRQRRGVGGDFESFWRDALHRGFVEASAPPALRAELRDVGLPAPMEASPLTVIFTPDAAVGAGEFSNNAWLQELPRPFTRITWDNAALLSPGTAALHGVVTGDVVSVTVEGRSVDAPAAIVPGQSEGTVVLLLGYGRTGAGSVGDHVGFDAFAVQPWRRRPVHLAPGQLHRRPGERQPLAVTQTERRTHGRSLVRRATDVASAPAPQQPSLYPPRREPKNENAWAMTIDLDACMGCGACTIACQAENNIPVVGREQVRAGRQMHWIRVDVYDEGPADAPRTSHQPVPCMHCENAPCEPVCPVGATVHDHDGLNVQIYNRCIGTRYCSNNCPYKVRRFNFLRYTVEGDDGIARQYNPDVTVRSGGVMEKCNYCLQRISRARIAAQRDDRDLVDGDVVTACEAVCPTRAITFGDLNDPDSRVRRSRSSPRHYTLLEELNTRPRTTYLARIDDPDALPPGWDST